MKSATKFKIINWHYFWNETIDLRPIVFLTGRNASGKSTLLDGLLVILLGDTSGRFFNKAAMDKSNRTLKGYLKGELGDTEDGGFRYLREGRFSSYLAVEFFDDVNQEYFTMGCVFDIFDDGSEEHRFFILNDKIPDNEFILNKTPMSYKQLLEYFKQEYPNKYTFLDSNKAYQEALKKKFGGLKDKYFQLLKKATSFTPITDITTFITEYVCDPQANIELQAMQETILQYKDLEAEASKLRKRIEKLEEIEDLYENFKNVKSGVKLCSYIIEKLEYQIASDRVASYYRQIDSYKHRLVEIDSELEDIEANKNELTRKKYQLIADQGNNDTYKMTSELLEEKKSLNDKIKVIEKDLNDVQSKLHNYANNYFEISKVLKENFDSINVDILDEDRVSDILEIKNILDIVIKKSKVILDTLDKGLTFVSDEDLNSWRESLFSFKQLVSAFCVSFARSIRNLESKLTSLRLDFDSLKRGVKAYDPTFYRIKNELQNRLTLKYNKQIDVEILADLIDISDKSWTNAIEGYIFNQKFHLFVEPRYYFDAYEILKHLLEENRFYQTSLVDQEKLIERDFKAGPNSLATEIITDHKGARSYINFLLGTIKKCENVQQARESQNGITRDCDIYRNFSLSKINPRLYANSFIGRNVGPKLILEKQSEIDNLVNLINQYRSLYQIINKANSLEIINTNEINSMLSDIKQSHELTGLRSSLNYIEEELSKHDVVEIDSIEKRINNLDEDLKQLQTDADNLNIEKGNLTTSIKTLQEDKIKEETKNIKEKEEHLNQNYDFEFVKTEGLPTLERELAENDNKVLEVMKKYQVEIGRGQYLSANVLNQIKKLRKEYVSDYHLSLNCDSEENTEFDNELIDLRDVKLPEYEEKIADAYNKATKQFKDDFIAKIRNQIEMVEDQINELNEALSASTFGNDSYQFTVKPNPVYKRYYDMFKDDLILSQDEDENEFITKYQDVMNDLFSQITLTSQTPSQDFLSNFEKFVDYRSYLDFDLIVTNKEGVKQRLSKMIKKKSGGETQTPFYISVLASFAQLYRTKEKGELSNTIRLIIFDEAFSKMDRGRIQESIKLLRKFNLQAIVSAPSEKLTDISELVDETLVVLHSKNSSCVRLYAKDVEVD